MTHAMAQIGIDPSAVAKGSVLFLLLAALSLALLVASIGLAAVGLRRLRHRRGRWMALCGCTVAAFLGYVIYSVCMPPHHSVDLDLSTSQSAPPGRWMIGIGNEQMVHYQGRVDLRLRLPEGHTFDDRVTLFSLTR